MAEQGPGRQEYGQHDPWGRTAEIDDVTARELAALLELRAAAEDQAMARAVYLDLLGVTPGERVLNVGCGSGAVLRDVGRRVDPDGMAVGLDLSPAMLAVAREIAEREGLAERVELHQGDARHLPFADADFDAVLAATLLSHVAEAERVIHEMARVVRPGGRVGIFDLDSDALVIAHPDRALTRRIVGAWADQAFVNGWLVRRLPELLTEAGLHDVRVRAFTPIERDPSGFQARDAAQMAELAVQIETITSEEHRRWLDALHAEQAAGRFLAGRTHLFVWGTRPLVMLVASDAEALAVEPTDDVEEETVAGVVPMPTIPVEATIPSPRGRGSDDVHRTTDGGPRPARSAPRRAPRQP